MASGGKDGVDLAADSIHCRHIMDRGADKEAVPLELIVFGSCEHALSATPVRRKIAGNNCLVSQCRMYPGDSRTGVSVPGQPWHWRRPFAILSSFPGHVSESLRSRPACFNAAGALPLGIFLSISNRPDPIRSGRKWSWPLNDC